jgi:hypothetical protein
MPRKTPQQSELFSGALAEARTAATAASDGDHRPPNLGDPVPVRVPDFADPRRPKTCLEVDFPILPIDELSRLEGNAGKPIYQMSKWWARRRSCVFRALLLAAAMQAPRRHRPDGGFEVTEDEAQQAVWDVYYANHQGAGNFKHLKVLDCFMGGGTTLVEGSRLGFQVAGVDLNPVAWFIVKNELACPDPDAVQALFSQIEAEVKPQLQPFYVTDCPRGHKGTWHDARSGKRAEVDPTSLPPDQRSHYDYQGPEVIYTFWAKHGPCIRQHRHGGDHRTPVFRTPVIAEKRLGVKYLDLTCKRCKTAFHAELGSARMAPAAERVVLPNEAPFTELSQPFARLLADYDKGRKPEREARIAQLADSVDTEPGLKCPACGSFAGEWVKDILAVHQLPGRRLTEVKKKDFNIQPPRTSVKPVYCYLLVHPDWLNGSPGHDGGQELGGYADSSPDADAAWYAERMKGLRLIEVRGRIKLAEDMTLPDDEEDEAGPEDEGGFSGEDEPETEGAGSDSEERKKYGLPRYLTLADGTQVDTRKGTVPAKSVFACGACGVSFDFLEAVKAYARQAGQSRSAPTAIYAVQGFCPQCEEEGHPYGGRFFAIPTAADVDRLVNAAREWAARSRADLMEWWPRAQLPHTWMTHHLNGGIPNWGFTHFYKMFSPRQLLVHSQLLRTLEQSGADLPLRDFVLGAFQQYLRNQNIFCIWDKDYDKLVPFLSNPHFHPKQRVVENCVFGALGRGTWLSCAGVAVDAARWCQGVDEKTRIVGRDGETGTFLFHTESVRAPSAVVDARSASELPPEWTAGFDLAVTDPPFGDNLFYGDLSNFFYVWLRLALRGRYPARFAPEYVPRDQEVVADRSRFPDTAVDGDERTDAAEETPAQAFYRQAMTACWDEVRRCLKDGGLLAFTFHHSDDRPWVAVLASLFDAGFVLEATYPIRSDETKGKGGQFGSRKIEYDIIHVCRKRLEAPTRVSWPKMRQWVKAELSRLTPLLNSYKDHDLSDADVRVILRGKALEFYSRHYGEVYADEVELLSVRDALLGINQLLDEDPGNPGERPPSIIRPVAYQFLRVFRGKAALPRGDVSKLLRGTGISQPELEQRGWVRETNKVVTCVPVQERFELARQRPRREMKTEVDRAHFLIGAALPGSRVNIDDELSRNPWMARRGVEAVLAWYGRTAPEMAVRQASETAMALLRRHIEQRRAQSGIIQRDLFDDLDDDI